MRSLDITALKPRQIGKTGVPVFAFVRDETYLMPYFLEHHRQLGVTDFVVFADQCSPEFLDFLHSQPDVGIFTSRHKYDDRFGPRQFHQVVKQKLPDQLFLGRWALTLDADEFLFLPGGYETVEKFAAALLGDRQPYCLAPMVDMYPARFADRNYDLALSPFQVEHYFDAGPYYTFPAGSPHPVAINGGVRQRIQRMLLEAYPEEMAVLHGGRPPEWAVNIKTPFLLHGSRLRLGSHAITGDVSGKHSVALAHYKFAPGLDAKVALTAQGDRQPGNQEYLAAGAGELALFFERLGDTDMRFEGSRLFTGADSLVAADLLPAGAGPS